MALPTVRGVSAAKAEGTTTVSPTIPSGTATGELMLLLCEYANTGTPTISAQAGGNWTLVGNAEALSGTIAGIAVFYDYYNGTQTAPTVTTPGNHGLARIMTITGARAGEGSTLGGLSADLADTDLGTTCTLASGLTTTQNDCLIVLAAASNDDNPTFGATWTNANLGSITVQVSDTTIQGNDGSLEVVTGTLATAGAVGTFTNTFTAANAWAAGLVIVIRDHIIHGVALSMTPSLPAGNLVVRSQVGWRGRNDTQGESSDGTDWKAAENTDWTQATDTNFRIRFVVDETAGGDPPTADYKYQYNKNGAGWNDVTASSLVVRASASANVANGTATTRQLSSGSGTFVAGAVDTNNGAFGNVDLAASNLTELEACAQIRSADVTAGDTIDLRVVDNTTGLPIEAYAQVPTITVGSGGATVTGVALSATPSLPAGSLLHTLTGVSLATTPTLPAGSLRHTVTGVALSATPTLPAASLRHGLTGTALSLAPSLPVALLRHALTGVALSMAPSLPVGVVQAPQLVTGVALSVAPSLPPGAVTKPSLVPPQDLYYHGGQGWAHHNAVP